MREQELFTQLKLNLISEIASLSAKLGVQSAKMISIGENMIQLAKNKINRRNSFFYQQLRRIII
jgi:hypothetical protein